MSCLLLSRHQARSASGSIGSPRACWHARCGSRLERNRITSIVLACFDGFIPPAMQMIRVLECAKPHLSHPYGTDRCCRDRRNIAPAARRHYRSVFRQSHQPGTPCFAALSGGDDFNLRATSFRGDSDEGLKDVLPAFDNRVPCCNRHCINGASRVEGTGRNEGQRPRID